ncbi:MAG: hypothetical protein AB1458_01675 [Bacteroidota bacterium]
MMKGMLLGLLFPVAVAAQPDSTATISIRKQKGRVKTKSVWSYPSKADKKKGILSETYAYDEKGRVTMRMSFYSNIKELYAYGKDGRLLALDVHDTYLNRFTYRDTFLYDDKGRLAQKLRLNMNVGANVTDVLGKKKADSTGKAQRAIASVTHYVYDSLGRLMMSGQTNATEKLFVFYTYDSSGNVLSVKKMKQVEMPSKSGSALSDTLFIEMKVYTYDKWGSLIVTETTDSYARKKKELHKYDAENRLEETSVFGDQATPDEKYTYAYDEKGNLAEQVSYDYLHKTESLTKFVYEFYD